MSNVSDIKKHVKSGYGKIAQKGGSCCSTSCCCGNVDTKKIGQSIGYSDEEMNVVPHGSNLGLGCGNPVALASLKEGDVVLDLGSGAGFDAFLAALKVGSTGKVIGVDMTPEMIEKARSNAKRGKYTNVEFRLGEIEKLPVDDSSIDVIISNCVINLSPDKESVFKESYRVLKNGGRLMISDLVLTRELPKNIKESIEAYVGCIAGAVMKSDYIEYLKKAGFQKIVVIEETPYSLEAVQNDATSQMFDSDVRPGNCEPSDAASYVVSLKIQATKE